MTRRHPLTILAPHFALAAFALTAVLGWRAHTEAVPLVMRCIVSFSLTYLLGRGGGSLLRVGDGTAPASPVRRESE